jgi:hypothetical protein
MQRRSPTLAGFWTVVSRPSLGLAEISWRWSFGFAATLLLTFSAIEYLDTLPVTSRDELMFRTRQPALISRAIAHILRGSSPRLIAAVILLAITLSLAWIVLASLGRVATVRSLLDHLRPGDPQNLSGESSALLRRSSGRFHLRSLIGLNFFRAAVALAALVGCVAAFLLGGAASPADDPSPSSAMLIFVFVVMLVGLAWSMLNWFLSLAAIFAVVDASDTFGAINAAVGLCRDRFGSIFAANTWFGLAHLVIFVIASSVVGFPLAFAGVLPAGVVLGGVLLVTLLYFAAADFLYIGRLAAYIAIIEQPEVAPAAEIAGLSLGIGPTLAAPTADFDRSELILSDLPNLIPET